MSSNKNIYKFDNHEFVIGEKIGKETHPIKKDLDRIISSIKEARRQADYVIVSIHSHEMQGEEKDKPAGFLKEFSRTCIDNGANAIVGHGPHVLRGIEIYKKCPIFYSLGNFIFQNDTVAKLPHDFYEKYNMSYSNNVADALNKRSDNGQKGLGVNKSVWESIIPVWKVQDGLLESIKLYPIDLGFNLLPHQKGWPKLTNNPEIVKKLQKLS